MSKVYLLGVLVVLGSVWLLWPASPVTNQQSPGTDIIAYGDSLIVGVGASEGNDLVSRLARLVDHQIINLGMSGDTTRDAVERIEVLDDYSPRVVILLVGGNDALQRVPLAETQAHLAELIEEIHFRGSAVLLLGVRNSLFADSYEEMFEELAQQHNTAYVSDVLAGVFGQPSLMSDLIHPNDAGYERIAERVEPALSQLLEE